jgi:carbon monoxide dehydrogenase subunit G
METSADFKESSGQAEVNLSVEWDLGIVTAMIGEEKLHHMMEKSLDLTISKWKAKAEVA